MDLFFLLQPSLPFLDDVALFSDDAAFFSDDTALQDPLICVTQYTASLPFYPFL